MFYADSNQCPSEWWSRMLPLSYTRRYNIDTEVTPRTQLIKTHVTVLLARPGPPLSIRLLYTILVGAIFPKKSMTTFALLSI